MKHQAIATYASSSADLVYGIDEVGRVVGVSEVPSGSACKCRCPSCGGALIAKKGDTLTHHFAHDASQACHRAPETALHRLAKQIVEEHLKLTVPEVKALYGDQSRVLHKASEVAFDRAVVEARHLNEVIPDLCVERDGRMLLIEMHVTHPCDDAKIAELRGKGIATLEIDLSRFPRDASREDVTQAVLFDAPRHWIYHPRVDAAVAEMKSAEAKARHAVREKFARKVEEFSAAYLSATEELQLRSTPKFDHGDEVIRAGLGDHVGIEVDGAGCFTIGLKEWQYAIIKHAFVTQDGTTRAYRTKALVDWFRERNLIRPKFRYVEPILEQALQDKNIGFLTPYRAIEAYLDELVDRGVLQKRRSYSLSSGVMSDIHAIRDADELRASRREDIDARVSKILAALPEAGGTRISDWLDAPQECGISFNDAIENDDPRFEPMTAALRAIEGMLFRKGAVASATLELPIDAERVRQRKQRQAEADAREATRIETARQASEARREKLAAASASLQPDGQTWTETPNPNLRGRKPVDMALASEDELSEALHELHREAQQQRTRREREQFKRDIQYTLANEVERLLEDAAKPFLGSPFPELGRRTPRDYCVSRETLKECLDLAEKVRIGRR